VLSGAGCARRPAPPATQMTNLVKRFGHEDHGQDLIEYVLLASFVAAAVILGATAVGTNLNAWYDSVGTWASKQKNAFP